MNQRSSESQLRVALVARRENGMTGTARYVGQLSRHLPDLAVSLRPVSPNPQNRPKAAPPRRVGVDLAAFRATYPLRVRAPREDEVDVYHLATQNLATLLLFQTFRRPVVVTVHDIIPYLTRNDRQLSSYRHAFHRFFDLLAMKGLKRADLLLADSEWTQKTLVRELGIAAERTKVIYPGVDAERFCPVPVPDSFWCDYTLDPRQRHLLYVGSDDPRKNVETLLRAFARVSVRCPDSMLLMVGPSFRPRNSDRIAQLTRELGIAARVSRVGPVPEDDLVRFYCAADLVAVPSHFEGFGLPVLESLACGTRVVCSNTASLPEVAGTDSILCDPTASAIENAVTTALEARCAARDNRRQWAREFTWTRTAQQVKDAYAGIVGSSG